MPELPEVESIVRSLDRDLSGQAFDCVRVLRKDVIHGDALPLSRFLTGRTVKRVHRRAKRIILDLGSSMQLIFHLGMTGRLRLQERDELLEKHTHLRVTLAQSTLELRFCDPRRFGGVWCLSGTQECKDRPLGPLGPEPLDLSIRAFRTLLDRQRQIKALLLDQHAIAGLGNIYCDEALHAAGIHPRTKSGDLTAKQTSRLLRSIKTVLRNAIAHDGSTWMDYRLPDGRKGSFQNHHRVYNREGQPCKRCGAAIVRILVAGRSSSLCPQCQPRQASTEQ